MLYTSRTPQHGGTGLTNRVTPYPPVHIVLYDEGWQVMGYSVSPARPQPTSGWMASTTIIPTLWQACVLVSVVLTGLTSWLWPSEATSHMSGILHHFLTCLEVPSFLSFHHRFQKRSFDPDEPAELNQQISQLGSTSSILILSCILPLDVPRAWDPPPLCPSYTTLHTSHKYHQVLNKREVKIRKFHIPYLLA